MARKAIAATVKTNLADGRVIVDAGHGNDPATFIATAITALSPGLAAVTLTDALAATAATSAELTKASTAANKNFVLSIDTSAITTKSGLHQVVRHVEHLIQGSDDLTS